ncbi:hypothetical protein ABH15_03995 [Methanoculleus taiwanensis]|uniref:Uncharacterized protein n=1 Tax=Methanoculleus taiwanensis TaxID=1550565 RepID=A0A498H396_9EURY|nr:hypothetical protein [Methanoculleus taiwanensis]RXE57273.1 hypothetical protein ABH15_03995 [Methanoculleus taiwanensis]
MKTAVTLIVLITVALLACGCTNTASVGETTPMPTATPAAEPAAPGVQTSEPSVSGQVMPVLDISGEGGASQVVDLKTGTYVVTTTREGTGYFTIELEKENCHIGLRGTDKAYSGVDAFGITMPGRYYLNVTDEGDSLWTIRVDRAAGVVDQSMPYRFEGTGDMVTGYFNLPAGALPLTVWHSGEDDLYVWLFDEGGNDVYAYPGWTLTLPGEGQSQETVTVEIPESRAYLLAVQCAGDWTLAIGE